MPKLISPGHGSFETPPLIVEIGATFVELLAVQRHLRDDGEEEDGGIATPKVRAKQPA